MVFCLKLDKTLAINSQYSKKNTSLLIVEISFRETFKHVLQSFYRRRVNSNHNLDFYVLFTVSDDPIEHPRIKACMYEPQALKYCFKISF